ncbi:MAG: hypothetical protein V7603_5180 [Micromonosporaceae bacterium]
MLQLRVEGDLSEARAFLEALAAGGLEVQTGTAKDRGGFHHVYAVVRMPGYASGEDAPGPVRATAVVSRRAIGGRGHGRRA